MPLITDRDPMKLMLFMAEAERHQFVHPIKKDEDWRDVINQIEDRLDETIQGAFRVHLGNETLLNNSDCEIVVYVTNADMGTVRKMFP